MGLQLTCGQLKQIIAALKIERPASNAKKVQLATCLVNALFDDAEASRDERKEMVANILKMRSCEHLDLDVMSTVASLDPENAESFRPAVSQIIREFTEKAFDAGRDAERELTTDELTKLRKEKAELLIQKDQTTKDDVAKTEKTRLWGLTPDSLKLLCPGAGSIMNTFSLLHHPVAQHFRAAYPLGSSAGSKVFFVLSCFLVVDLP